MGNESECEAMVTEGWCYFCPLQEKNVKGIFELSKLEWKQL